MLTPKPVLKSLFLLQLIPYAGMFVLALLLWLPFGFKTTGLVEEIGINYFIDHGEQLFFITPESELSTVVNRPFQMFTFAAAYALDHDSYLFYNIFMLLFFFGEMVVAYGLILQFLPGKKAVAFVTGLLFAIYPADTGLFALRTIHIHCATLAYLIALYLFLKFWKLNGSIRWLAFGGMMLFLVFSLAQYEIALVAALFTPFVLLYFTRPNKRFFMTAGLWYAAMAIPLLYGFSRTHGSTLETYTVNLLGPDLLSIASITGMLQALLTGYQRQFLAWSNALNELNYLPLFWPFIGAGLIISTGMIWWLSHKQSTNADTKPINRWQYGMVLIGGLLFFALGMATYLPIPSHRIQDFRIYFLAMLGSATVLSLGLYLLSLTSRRFSKILFAIFVLPFIGLALLNALQQQQYFVNFSLQQQSILQQTIAQAPQVKPHTAILYIDKTGILDQEYVFYYGIYLNPLMKFVYGDATIDADYCLSNDIPTSMGVSCDFSQNELSMSYDIAHQNINGPLMNVPMNQVLIFTTEAHGQLKLLSAEDAAREFNISGYNPQARIIGQNPLPRASALFSCEPALSCYRAAPNMLSTGFDLPTTGEIGTGWRPTEDDGMGGTFRWSINPKTSVNVDFSDQGNLLVDFKVLHWVEEPIMNSLKLSLYGLNLPLTFEPTEDGGRIYHATIPSSFLVGQPSHAYLVFAVDRLTPISKDVSLGFALNWLRIRPN